MKDSTARIVSSDREQLILVDEDDRETGTLSKAACHDGSGMLHRAFSVFLFDDSGRLLLQQRAAGKRLWPLFWSNSCCSHPRAAESMEDAVSRRLDDELHTRAELEYRYKFAYHARFGDFGSERELCHVYLGLMLSPPAANPTEIEAVRYVTPQELEDMMDREPETLTPWFQMEWRCLREEHAGALTRYCRL